MLNERETKAHIVRLVHSAFNEAKVRRGTYSLRQFARKLGIAPPVLVQVLNGKRNLTRRLALQLLSGIRIDTEEAQGLISSIPAKQSRNRKKQSVIKSEAKQKKGYAEIAASQLSVLSDWWNFAILALAETESFQSVKNHTDKSSLSKWIATKLGISETAALRSIDRLVRLKLLVKTSDQRLKPSGETLTTSFDIPNIYIRKNHTQGLELAAERIHEIPTECRDYSSMTIAINRNRLDEAKKKIEKFRRELASFLEEGTKDEVYRLQIQLFPLEKHQPIVNNPGESP